MELLYYGHPPFRRCLILYEELEQAEGGIDTKQENPLPAVQLFPGQRWNRQQQHDNQHQGNVQH